MGRAHPSERSGILDKCPGKLHWEGDLSEGLKQVEELAIGVLLSGEEPFRQTDVQGPHVEYARVFEEQAADQRGSEVREVNILSINCCFHPIPGPPL